MNIIFKENKIQYWADRYKISEEEEKLIALKALIQQQNYINKDQLKRIAYWKSPRAWKNIERNTNNFIEEISHISLSARDERTKIEVLTLLDGVMWPTASVIMHLYHNKSYPILDFRALWSLGQNVPSQYNYSFWCEYKEYCCKIANTNNISMRTLDRALWQYSKENG